MPGTAHTGMPEITLERAVQMNRVSTSYEGGIPALEQVSLSIARGTNYAIVGPSGSGKSTLLKLMNGMMAPTAGTVRMGYARPDSGDRAFRKMMHRIGYIPQNLGLVRNTSVLENVLVGALPRMGLLASALKRFPPAEVAEARRIIGQVGLGGKESRRAHMLSGGERRRVAIARALMQRPDVLLADEIVSELDQATAREIMDLLADAQGRLGLTAVMVHHDIRLALEYANRVAVIRDGRKILEIGVEGDTIVDFESGGMTSEQVLEEYGSGAAQ